MSAASMHLQSVLFSRESVLKCKNELRLPSNVGVSLVVGMGVSMFAALCARTLSLSPTCALGHSADLAVIRGGGFQRTAPLIFLMR